MKDAGREITFFFDNCISKKLAAAMRVLGATNIVHLQDDGFSEDAEDIEWVPKVAQRGHIIVTGDKKMLSRPHELEALRVNKATAFFLCKRFVEMQRWDQAAWLFQAWPSIMQAASRALPGQCFDVAENRKVSEAHTKG